MHRIVVFSSLVFFQECPSEMSCPRVRVSFGARFCFGFSTETKMWTETTWVGDLRRAHARFDGKGCPVSCLVLSRVRVCELGSGCRLAGSCGMWFSLVLSCLSLSLLLDCMRLFGVEGDRPLARSCRGTVVGGCCLLHLSSCVVSRAGCLLAGRVFSVLFSSDLRQIVQWVRPAAGGGVPSVKEREGRKPVLLRCRRGITSIDDRCDIIRLFFLFAVATE